MNQIDRRGFLRVIGHGAAVALLAPVVVACSADEAVVASTSGAEGPPDPLAVPRTRPDGWDPIAFNRTRGNAGAIPESYLPQINGPDGVEQHLGKHLPYVPVVEGGTVPSGMLALMWGDPSRGYAPHPNAVRSAANNDEGHWYNWIEIRKATDGAAETSRSEYAEWPSSAERTYLAQGGGDLTDNSGKNTIYLAALPADVRPGDLVRIHAHCLTHGEYVDFLVVPG